MRPEELLDTQQRKGERGSAVLGGSFASVIIALPTTGLGTSGITHKLFTIWNVPVHTMSSSQSFLTERLPSKYLQLLWPLETSVHPKFITTGKRFKVFLPTLHWLKPTLGACFRSLEI